MIGQSSFWTVHVHDRSLHREFREREKSGEGGKGGRNGFLVMDVRSCLLLYRFVGPFRLRYGYSAEGETADLPVLPQS